jgi:hypothetical protein
MASSYFFDGRLWTTPAAMSLVNDNAMLPVSLTVGNVLALLGTCRDGQPNTPLSFGDPSDVRKLLGDGELTDAAEKAFAPSDEVGGPSTVVCIRVGTSTPATLTLNDASTGAAIALASASYGVTANLTKVQIAAGTLSGKMVSTQRGATFYVGDNIGRSAFTVRYSGGAASAQMAINNATVTLSAPTGTPVAVIDLATYASVTQLVDRINATPGFVATVTAGSDNTPSLNGLDTVTAQDVKTANYVARADLQAIVDWLNTVDTLVVATRVAGAGAVPVNLSWTYLAGGTDPAVLVGDWTNAMTTLQTVDAQWVVPLSGDPAIHAAMDAHVQFMSHAGRHERRALVGPPAGTLLSAVLLLPLALNSDRTAMVWPGYYDFNSAGVLTLYPPYMAAAVVAAGFAGSNPGLPMTNKALTVRGLETVIRDPVDTDALIQAGVLCLSGSSKGFKVVRSVSTWLVNNKFNRVEVSCGAATDFTVRNVREALDVLKGSEGDPLVLQRAVSITESALIELSKPRPEGPGVLVGDANSPPYKSIRASLQGDVLQVSFQCSPVIPVNFIPITVSVLPFSGTASL